MKSSGSNLVVLIVLIAVAFGAGTWWFYSADNPTTTDATLSRREGQWIVQAKFPDRDERSTPFVVGTGAIVSSTSFPGLRMTGMIETVNPDDSVVIVLDHTPPEDTAETSAPAAVSIDSATAPK